MQTRPVISCCLGALALALGTLSCSGGSPSVRAEKGGPGKAAPGPGGTGQKGGAQAQQFVPARTTYVVRGAGGVVQWARRYGHEYLRPYGLTQSATGEVFLTASLNTQEQPGRPAGGSGMDIFVAKLDPAGSTLWSKFFTGKTGSRIVSDIAADPSGSLLLTGVLHGQVSLGGSTVLSSTGWNAQQHKGPASALLAKLSPAGQSLMGKRYGAVKDAAGQHIGTDDKGEVAVGGAFSGTLDFGGGIQRAGGAEALFLVKLDIRGKQAFARRIAASKEITMLDLAMAPAGDVAIGGIFSGDVDLGGGALHASTQHNGFLARYDAAGKHALSLRLGNAVVESVALTRDGDLVVAGEAPQQPDPFWAALCQAGDSHPFLVKFDKEGQLVFRACYGDPHNHQVNKVAVDAAGHIFLLGSSRGVIDFGGGPLLPMGPQDVFLVKLDGTGRHLWSKRFNPGDRSEGLSLAVDDAGNAAIIGSYAESFDVGAGQSLPSGGGVFVAKFGP